MANEITTIDRASADIERVLSQCNTLTIKELPVLRQAIVLASGVTQLRKVLTTELMNEVFMPLQGRALGFVTDKDKDGGYPMPVVRDVIIEAMIHGFRPVGNEINIIAGRFYGAKNGFARKVREWPGLTDLRITPGVPVMSAEKGALVPMHANWRVNGSSFEHVRDLSKDSDGVIRDSRIPVRVNSGMGADAVIGKALRKMLAAIYDILAGSEFTINDGEVGESIYVDGVVVPTEASPAPSPPDHDGKRISLKRTPSSTEASLPNVQDEPGSNG